jgi:quinol monooxygenase YgiN
MTVFVRGQFDVRPGKQADFQETALALRQAARDKPGTLSYRWFSLPDSASYFTLEEYADSAAVLAHLADDAELLARMRQSSDLILVELYGPIGPELRALMDRNPKASILPEFPAS